MGSSSRHQRLPVKKGIELLVTSTDFQRSGMLTSFVNLLQNGFGIGHVGRGDQDEFNA
jgi:hypothetical protein